jgi:hypothetical protein
MHHKGQSFGIFRDIADIGISAYIYTAITHKHAYSYRLFGSIPHHRQAFLLKIPAVIAVQIHFPEFCGIVNGSCGGACLYNRFRDILGCSQNPADKKSLSVGDGSIVFVGPSKAVFICFDPCIFQ